MGREKLVSPLGNPWFSAQFWDIQDAYVLHTANVTLMVCNKETQTKHIAKSLSLGIFGEGNQGG